MARKVSAAQAKAHLSELAARVAHRGEHYIIERRGKPVAALVSVDELEKLEQGRATAEHPVGALALVSAWREIEDQVMDDLISQVYAEREKDTGRSVELDD